MEKKYTIKKASPMGDRDPKYGQTYWCEVNEQIQPIMFNLMKGSVQEGDRLTAQEVLLKTSSKGTEYHRLKKVTVEEGAPRIVNFAQESNVNERLARLEEAVFGAEEAIKDKIIETASEVRGELEDEETINLDDIPF